MSKFKIWLVFSWFDLTPPGTVFISVWLLLKVRGIKCYFRKCVVPSWSCSASFPRNPCGSALVRGCRGLWTPWVSRCDRSRAPGFLAASRGEAHCPNSEQLVGLLWGRAGKLGEPVEVGNQEIMSGKMCLKQYFNHLLRHKHVINTSWI